MQHYEADYFRHAFLHKYLGLKKDWPELVGPFNYLAETASGANNQYFLHRDFQSRNIMVSAGKIIGAIVRNTFIGGKCLLLIVKTIQASFRYYKTYDTIF